MKMSYTTVMENMLGMAYAIVVCALGGMTGQKTFGFYKPRLGLIWAGLVAAMSGFLVMIALAVLTQWIFGYPPIAPSPAPY